MKGVCRGIVSTVEALQQVDPEILPVHVDATDRYTTADATLEKEAAHRQQIVFLALDLVSGRVNSTHPLADWLSRHGFTSADFEWFETRAVTLSCIGINLYPMFTEKVLARTARGGVRIAMTYAKGELIDDLSTMYWRRYQSPLFISETASTGSVRRRQRWLDDSIATVRRVRASGIPLIGYTWWPLFALVTWAYRQGSHPPEFYLKQMGLWDLDAAFRRLPTTLVRSYRELVQGGTRAVGFIPQMAESAPAALEGSQ